MNLKNIVSQVEEKISPVLEELSQITFKNHQKVLNAFKNARVTEYHLKGTTGYGYSDTGRQVIEEIYSQVFNTEAALVRGQISSGTHAIALGLYGNLFSGDELVCINGAPYDTLQEIIGIRGNSKASLMSIGVKYRQVELTADGSFDYQAINQAVNKNTKMVLIQRSRGYAWRKAFSVKDIEDICQVIREINPQTIIFVDNCYGELVEAKEPTEVGADLVAGSLIKNLGGGLAPTGGYLAGRKELIDNASERLTAPGIGSAIGATMDWNRWFLQGAFLAPHTVSEALKGAIFTAGLYSELGYEVSPMWNEDRSDLIQGIKLGSSEAMVRFCQALQQASPVDSHLIPEPWEMPGYDNDIIMSGGTFVQGSTMELSADGPLREPYAVYLQGGLSYHYVKIAVISAAERILHNT